MARSAYPQGFKPLAMNTLLFQSSDDTFDHSVLFWAARSDELLFRTVAAGQGREALTGEFQAIVSSKQERLLYSPQVSKPCGLGSAQGYFGLSGVARTRQMRAPKLPGEAINHQCECHPVISVRPDSAYICCPALIGSDGWRRRCLYSRSKANRTLFCLPTPGYGGSSERCSCSCSGGPPPFCSHTKAVLDRRLNRYLQALPHLRSILGGLKINRSHGHLKPMAKLGHRNPHPFSFQSLLAGPNHSPSPPIRYSNFSLAQTSNIAFPDASRSALSCRSYFSLVSRGLARRKVYKPCLPSSTQSLISESEASNTFAASETAVFPCKMPVTRAVVLLAVQCLTSLQRLHSRNSPLQSLSLVRNRVAITHFF